MSTLEQRLWLFTSTKMPCVKVPGSPVSWIATCMTLVTMVDSILELVTTLLARARQREVFPVPGGPWSKPNLEVPT